MKSTSHETIFLRDAPHRKIAPDCSTVLNILAAILRPLARRPIMGESTRPTHGALGWPAAMIVWGPGFTAARHSHHSVQLVMAMRGTLLVRSGPEEEWRKCGAALIRPDAFHQIDARVRTVVIAFVDSESELGAALCDR